MSGLVRRALMTSALALPAAAQTPRLPPPTPAAPAGPAAAPGTAGIPLDDRVAPGWRRDVLIRWGDRVLPGAPVWDPNRPDPDAAAAQFGWDAVIVAAVAPPPAADSARRAVLAVAHPTLDPAMALPAGQASAELAGAMQGASIINLEFQGAGRAARWVVVEGGFQSRRITATTLCRIAGPAAGVVGESVRGLVAPQGGCPTPWGSVLFAEGEPVQAAPWAAARMADTATRNRFGWLVEVDPLEPVSLPVKRTAPGRRAHGDVAATRGADGRAVLYITETIPGGFLYRFVSSARIAEGPDADNSRLLDEGTLFVARRAGDRGVWVRLPDTTAARLDPHAAAQQLGATPLDQPSGLVAAADGRVFVALRGDPMAGPDRAGGRIVELGGDPANDEAFGYATLVAVPAGLRLPGVEAVFATPDTLALDEQGRLWAGTAQGALQAQSGSPDGLFLLTLDGGGRAAPRRIYAAPRGGAIGGAAFAPRGGEATVLAAVRRPGYERGASFASPVTRWPAFDPALPPRTTLIALTPG
jgi:secreted PhoX family phosphatase